MYMLDAYSYIITYIHMYFCEFIIIMVVICTYVAMLMLFISVTHQQKLQATDIPEVLSYWSTSDSESDKGLDVILKNSYQISYLDV